MNQGSWKTLRLYALYSLGAAIVLSAIFLFYLHRTETAIEAQAETQLAEVTRQYTKAIETDLEGNLQLVRALALALGRLGVSAPSEILPLLRDESILGGYKRMGVITLDGMAHTTDGREFDASDRAYFRRALQSESTLAAMLVDKTDKRPINVYAAPILHGDHVAAVLFATVPTDAFLNHIDDRLFNGRGQVLVTDVSGPILFRGKGQVRLNRYANISELFPFEAPPPGEADSMHAGHQGMFHYEGQTFFIAHTPMTFLTHWNVYSLVPESTLNADAGSIQQGVLLLLLFFILMSMFFLGFIMRMQGGYGRTARPESITQKQTVNSSGPSEDIARPAGARVVNISEPDKKMVLSAALVKTLTGNDKITARFLNENSFEFYPQFKFFINTNHLPKVTDVTVFSSGRVKVIPFERHFSEAEQDKSLKRKLAQVDNLSGVLNWCLDGLRLAQETGFDPPPAVLAATAQYQRDSDKITRFVEETMEPDITGEIRTEEAYQRYQNWCALNGQYPESMPAFKQSMEAHTEYKFKRPRGAGRDAIKQRFFCGMKWR